jgi:hypothetical protein
MSPGTKQSTEIRTDDGRLTMTLQEIVEHLRSSCGRDCRTSLANRQSLRRTNDRGTSMAAPRLMALLPLADRRRLCVCYRGRVMSTENAYVEAEKVEISTDVSGVFAALRSPRIRRSERAILSA